MKKECITVFTANQARQLLRDGYKIVDIKPNRNDTDGRSSVFVFQNEDGLIQKINKKGGTHNENNNNPIQS